MYIVTYSEYSIVRDVFEPNVRLTEDIVEALDFMKILYESGYVKEVCLWNAEMMDYRCEVTATIKLTSNN